MAVIIGAMVRPVPNAPFRERSFGTSKPGMAAGGVLLIKPRYSILYSKDVRCIHP